MKNSKNISSRNPPADETSLTGNPPAPRFVCADVVSDFIDSVQYCRSIREVLEHTGRTMAEQLPEALVAVTSIVALDKTVRIVFTSFTEEQRRFVKGIIGTDPALLEYSLDEIPSEDMNEFFSTRAISLLPGGTWSLVLHQIPEQLCREAEKVLGVRHTYWSGFMMQDLQFGGLAILSGKKLSAKDSRMIDTLVDLVSFICQKLRAEVELIDAEKKFRSVFDNAREGMFMSLPGDGYVAVNLAEARMFGYDSVQEYMDSHKDIASVYVNPELRSQFIEQMARDGYVQDFQYQAYRRDGSIIWISENAHCVHDDNGLLKYYEGTLLDITVQKSGIDHLRSINEEMACLNRISEIAFSSIEPDSVFAPIVDAISMATRFEHVAIEFHDPKRGVMECKALSSNVGRMIPCPFDVNVDATLSSRVVTTGKPLWDQDVRRSRAIKDPRLMALSPRTFLCVPLRAIQGIIGTLTLFDSRDIPITSDLKDFVFTLANHVASISGRIRSELALRKSELEFRCITTAAYDGIIMINPKGKIEYWNKAAETIFGFKESEALGRDAHALLAPAQYHSRYSSAMQEFSLTGRGAAIGVPMELRSNRKDGSEITIELSLGSLQVHDQWQAVAIIRDVTKRKQVETELIAARQKAEESNNLKSMLLNNMSHELRTPMNGILGFAGLLCEELADPMSREMAENILASGNRLMRTLDSVIDLSALQSDSHGASLHVARIEPLIERAIEPYLPICAAKGLYLKVDFKEDLKATLDSRLIVRLLDYLLDNAVKYTHMGGIRISMERTTARRKHWVAVHISDTGIGISPEKLDFVFGEFRQESEGYGRAYEGAGIGLSISRKIVEAMHGRLQVESRKGEGSTFSVLLPVPRERKKRDAIEIVDADAEAQVAEESLVDLPSLLLVEDNKINVELVLAFLEGKYMVEFAGDAIQAIECAKNRHYDGILMDINLGEGIDGLEAAKIIKVLPGYDRTPIIALTGFALSADEERILAGGCTHYLAKPFTRHELLQIIEKALG